MGTGGPPTTTILDVFSWLRRLFGRPAADPLAGLEAHRLRLVVGLGNPGPNYAATRHNVGFRVVDALAQRCGAGWSVLGDAQSQVAIAQTADLSLVLAKPQTFMNRSGSAVQRLLERLELARDQCLVVYDEMDLPLGGLRLRARGSAGTHNGMRSVVAALGTEDVPRLRIGISQAGAAGGAIDHVLGEFAPDEQGQVDEAIDRAAEAVLAWAQHGAAAAMNRFNKT
jgi:PTH1 family peptidyl-tRNA hydrolase